MSKKISLSAALRTLSVAAVLGLGFSASHTWAQSVPLDDIDALVDKTLEKFATSKFHSKAKACSALYSRLISSGELRETKIHSVGGRILDEVWKTGM